MKTTFNRISAAAFVAVVTLSLPALPASAVDSTAKPSTFCTRIGSLMSANESTLDAHVATMKSDFAARTAQLGANQQNLDQKVAAARAKTLESFNQKVADLAAQEGLTDAQKTAIETFKTDMTTAEQTRRTAVDAARGTYRTQLKATITNYQTSLTNAVTTYQAAVRSAFSGASTGCGDGSALTTLRTNLKTARETLQASLKRDNIGIKELAQTRRSAVQAANTSFKESVREYTATLTAVLGGGTQAQLNHNNYWWFCRMRIVPSAKATIITQVALISQPPKISDG